METFFSAHTHSEFSCLDGMSSVPALVAKAARHGHPAIALTDHGNMSGAVQLYRSCKEYSLLPFIGVEAYLVPEHDDWHGRAKRYHVGLLALDFEGYKALVGFTSMAYMRPRFNARPRVDLADLAALGRDAGKHVALLTGCYFGLFQQALVTKGFANAKRIAQMYANMFPHTYVELQNHNTHHDGGEWTDGIICKKSLAIADMLGLPVVVTPDSHYLNVRDGTAHDLMKRSVYGDGEDNVFPGDSYHYPSTDYIKSYFSPRQWSAGLVGLGDLYGRNKLTLPALEKFQAYVPSLVKDPQFEIRSRCALSLKNLLRKLMRDGVVASKTAPTYEHRLQEELRVIRGLNFAGYFTLVSRVVKWCEEQGIYVEARGSSNGSLVCYLLGITQVDPIQWDCMFERFLSVDRIKPPDIDLDIEDTRRKEVLEYIASHFEVMQTGTYQKVGENDEGRGSVLVSYLSGLRKKFGNDEFRKLGLGGITSIDDVRRWDEADYFALKLWASVETRRSYGVHAAGLLLSSRELSASDYVPTMLVASSDTTVTQFVGDDLEELGFCKLDILGQRTLRLMKRCQELLGFKKSTDFTWIPWDDDKALSLLRDAHVDMGIFHFEQYAKSRGARGMQPQSTRDIILAMALFMPGAMDSGETDKYLAARTAGVMGGDIEYIHPAFEEALSWTYGCVIFQEQVIEIMRNLGMTIEAINIFFKVVKDSGSGSIVRNEERLRQVRAEFNAVCKKNGIKDIDTAWESTAGFVAYGFNKAHATGYGIRAYRCAYLKAHHTLEYMAALLESVAGDTEHEEKYVKEARRCGLRILPPDVNISGINWTIDPHKKRTLRKGISSVKGVGVKAANSIASNAPYADLRDLAERTDSRAVTGFKDWLRAGHRGRIEDLNGVALALKNAGAFISLGIERFD